MMAGPAFLDRNMACWAMLALFWVGCVGYRTPPQRNEVAEPVLNPGDSYLLVLGDDGSVNRYDSNTNSLFRRGAVSCAGQTPTSMSLGGMGSVYFSNSAGQLCVTDLSLLSTRITPFNAALVGHAVFGMAVAVEPDSGGETIYLAPSAGQYRKTLCRVDPADWHIEPVGEISAPTPYIELTQGLPNSLYALAVGRNPAELLKVDSTQGVAIVLATVDQNPAAAVFALVYWQGDVLLFLGSKGSGSSEMYRYAEGDSVVEAVARVPLGIAGVGVARVP